MHAGEGAGASAGAAPRVLIVHNAYQQYGGEDAVVEAETELLRRHGHPVHRYTRHNQDIAAGSGSQLALQTLWSRRTTADIDGLLAEFRPDVIHAHNTLPLISPSLYWAAKRAAVPVVQTLHNFRLMCPQAMLFRDGGVCEDCVGRVPWRAVVHRCYRDSALQSAAVAAAVHLHRLAGTWNERVALYVALNDFCKRKFVQGGLPASRIRIKPNFVDLPAPPPRKRHGLLFVGRLSPEKGLGVLAQALRLASFSDRVRVAGSGPEQAQMEGLKTVDLLGQLSTTDVYEEMARASALVLPSLGYENFPRVLVEAYAQGLPVVASRIGALAELVSDGLTGLLFEPGDSEDLARKLSWACDNPSAMRRMGESARIHYEKEWAAQTNYRTLISIYSEAIAGSSTSVAQTAAAR